MATVQNTSSVWKVNWGGGRGAPKPLRPIRVTGLHELETVGHYCFDGKLPVDKELRLLSICSGKPDTALSFALQTKGINAKIVHWEPDASALEEVRDIVRRHGFEHQIQWMTGPIETLQAIFGDDGFHYIACQGSLNYAGRQESAAATLSTIRSLLTDGGAIGLAVAGRYGRYGAHAMRELMEYVTTENDSRSTKVDLARASLASLGPFNWTKLSMGELPPGVADGSDEEALLETFFGEDDTTYSIDEIYGLLDAAELHWTEFERGVRPLYQPLFSMGDPEFQAMVERLPLRDQHAAAELTWCLIGEHRLWASTKRPGSTLADASNAENVPFFNPYARVGGIDWRKFLLNCSETANLRIRLHGDYQATMTLHISPTVRAMLSRIDGIASLGELAECVANAPEVQHATSRQVLEEFASFLGNIGRFDALLLRHKDVASLPFWDEVDAGAYRIC